MEACFDYWPAPKSGKPIEDDEPKYLDRVAVGTHFELAVGAICPSYIEMNRAQDEGFNIVTRRTDDKIYKDDPKRLNVVICRGDGAIDKMYFG